MSTFDELIGDLTRDVYRARPPDVLQYCTDWFQKRLVEQRNLMRGALIQASSQSQRDSFMGISRDTFQDRPLYSQPDLISPFSAVPQTRSSSLRTSSVPRVSMPFVHGLPNNAYHPPPNPTFRLDGAPTFSNPFGAGPIHPTADHLAPAGVFDRRQSVAAESIDLHGENDDWEAPVYPKSKEQLNRIRTSIKDNLIFRNLDEGQTTSVLNAMQEDKLPKDSVIIKQGESGATFYVVESGMFHCYIRPEPFPNNWLDDDQRQVTTLADDEEPYVGDKPDHSKFGKKVAECGPGQSFGELALMHGHARAATVLAMEPSTVWTLDRTTFRTIILSAADQRRKMFEKFLESVPLLVSLSPGERSKIADALISTTYEDGEPVVTQGELGETFYFVDEGEAVVTKEVDSGDGEATEVGRLHHGDYFGELSLLRKEPRAATVMAYKRTDPSQPKLKVAALDAGAFTRLLGPLRGLMERNTERYSVHR
ncbi:cyclic nucleotide-binding-like protein [Flagelloscypha sp. PMI_526]|nr:cyclic nucleotide-binding-like protein [Flagelloscypha sp. PMI_526]